MRLKTNRHDILLSAPIRSHLSLSILSIFHLSSERFGWQMRQLGEEASAMAFKLSCWHWDLWHFEQSCCPRLKRLLLSIQPFAISHLLQESWLSPRLIKVHHKCIISVSKRVAIFLISRWIIRTGQGNLFFVLSFLSLPPTYSSLWLCSGGKKVWDPPSRSQCLDPLIVR